MKIQMNYSDDDSTDDYPTTGALIHIRSQDPNTGERHAEIRANLDVVGTITQRGQPVGLDDGVGGSGTANTIPKWSDPSTLVDSRLSDDGSAVLVRSGQFRAGDIPGDGNACELFVDDATNRAYLQANGNDSAIILMLNGVSFTARMAAGAASFTLDGDDSSAVLNTTKVGFFNTTPVARPQVPATVTAQDIVNALIALGLISQAP